MGRLIDIDPSGRKVYAEDKGNELVITKTIDKAALRGHLEANKASVNAVPQKSYKSALRKKNMWKVASVPNWVVEQWMREGINIFKDEDWPKIKAKLNDPDYKFLRTSPGRV